jgi:hypothetical protein
VGTSRRTVRFALGAAVAGGFLLLIVRFLSEHARTALTTDQGVISSPVLRAWINLPALLVISLLVLGARLVVRDVTHGRVKIGQRYFVTFLVGLGLARSFAFGVGHYPVISVSDLAEVIPSGGVEAAAWLQEHSDPSERVITNAHCRPVEDPGDTCDSRHFWMSALTERRFVIEGWAYTTAETYWTDPFPGDPEMLRKNDLLFAKPSERRLEEYVAQHPAGWLFVDISQHADLSELVALPGLDLSLRRGNYAVLRITERGLQSLPGA